LREHIVLNQVHTLSLCVTLYMQKAVTQFAIALQLLYLFIRK